MYIFGTHISIQTQEGVIHLCPKVRSFLAKMQNEIGIAG